MCDTQNGQTALMLAGSIGSDEAMKILLKYQPKVDMQDSAGETALIITAVSARNHHQEHFNHCVQLLIEAGADTHIRTKHGETAYSLAPWFSTISMSLLMHK